MIIMLFIIAIGIVAVLPLFFMQEPIKLCEGYCNQGRTTCKCKQHTD